MDFGVINGWVIAAADKGDFVARFAKQLRGCLLKAAGGYAQA